MSQFPVFALLRNRLRSWSLRLILSVLVVAVAVVYQAGALWRGWAGQAISEVREVLDLPAWKRAALFLGGPGFAGYIEFIRNNTSPQARIVLPPRSPPRAESNVGLMQFYLFPRDIQNCGVSEVEACVRRITGSNSYILALSDFPPRELALQTRKYIPFDDDRGLFGPP